MHHDVFLSHSSKDKPIADAVCASLEQAGIRVWMAPRDIKPGKSWAGSIVDAIEVSAAMVIIFSENSNSSSQVMREIERAVQKDVVVVPFRIDRCTPTSDFEYFLSSTHWLDALSPEMDHHLDELTNIVSSLLSERGIAREEQVIEQDRLQKHVALQTHELHLVNRNSRGRASAAQPSHPKSAQKSGGVWKVLGIVLAALLVGWFLGTDPDVQSLVMKKFDSNTLTTSTPSENTDNESSRVSEPDPTHDLLLLCESHFDAKRLTSGNSGNALECYKRVLNSSPSNVDALTGIERIEQTYASWSLENISDGEIDTAKQNLQKLLSLNPNHLSVSQIEEAIKASEQDSAKEREDRKLLAQANRQKRLDKEASEKRMAQVAEQNKLAEQEERKKLNDELERQRITEISRQQLLQQEAERKHLAEQAQRNRAAQEAEKKRLAIVAEKKFRAEQLERARLAKLEWEKFVFGSWTGSGKDMSAGTFYTSIELGRNTSTLRLSYPSINTKCEYRLIPKSPLQDLKAGEDIRFDSKKVSGSCLNFRLRLSWTKTNQLDYKGYKLGFKYASAQLLRGE